MMPKVLLLEDDINLSKETKHQLNINGYDVDTVFDGNIAERMILRNQYDIILADINVPGKNGYDLVKHIRSQQVTTPVIMITAFGEIDDKLTGFESGADDYITKPFYIKELLARMQVLLKRNNNAGKGDVIKVEDLEINIRKREVSRGGTLVKLTSREYDILLLLAEAGGDVVPKNELIKRVWGSSISTNNNTIEVFINLLRGKIDKNFDVKLIKTKIGFGYYLSSDT